MQGPAPFRGSGEEPSLPPPAPGGSRCPLACGRVTLIPASVLTSSVALPVCFNSPLSLTRTFVIGLRPHLDNPGGPHLETLILMTSAENLTPNPVTFLDSKWMSIWGATIEPIASLRLPFPWQQEEQTVSSQEGRDLCCICSGLQGPLQRGDSTNTWATAP